MKWTLEPAQPFAPHAERWQRLNARNGDTPLLDPDFVAPLLTEWGLGREVVAVAGEPDDPAAMLLVTPAVRLGWATFQPSQAPIGLLVRDPAFAPADLLRSLQAALPWSCVVFSLMQQDPDLTPRPADNGRLRTVDYIRTARIAVEGTFDDYWKARGRNLRKNLKRQRNGLARDGIATRLETLERPEDVADAIALYGRLESASWKASEGTAIHPDNDQGRYYRTMLESFCRRGEGRIYKYWYGDQLAAMDLCIHRHGVLIILKTTYDETIEGSSPAMLMRQEAFEQIFADGRFKRIEFYGRVMDWHTKWSDDIRTLFHANCARWAALWKVRRLLRRGSV
jgi:CelD/BcsL family acetyltransferase involved in cellulose biosynthesis